MLRHNSQESLGHRTKWLFLFFDFFFSMYSKHNPFIVVILPLLPFIYFFFSTFFRLNVLGTFSVVSSIHCCSNVYVSCSRFWQIFFFFLKIMVVVVILSGHTQDILAGKFETHAMNFKLNESSNGNFNLIILI